MNAMANTRGSFHINSGPPMPGLLVITREVHFLKTLGPRMDKSWSHRDKAGHFHAYSTAEERYPTLYEINHPCASPHLDGDDWWCECFTSWQCRICGETITPGMIQGPHEEAHPGMMSWEVLLDLETTTLPRWDIGGMVTVEAITLKPPATRFGIAVVSSMNVQMFADLVNVKAVLTGAGSLGERGKR